MNETEHAPEIPRWLLVGTAICILAPDLILLYQLTPAFRHSHQLHPTLRSMVDSEATAQFSSILAELMRPVASLFLAWGFLRRRFLTVAALYLALRIIFPLWLAMKAPQVFGWSFAPILLHVLALAGVVYIRRLNRANAAPSARQR